MHKAEFLREGVREAGPEPAAGLVVGAAVGAVGLAVVGRAALAARPEAVVLKQF